MSFLGILVIIAAILGLLFLTLCLACGLYYLSELIEEYTVFSKKVITVLIYCVIGIHVLLWLFDGFPLWRVSSSIAFHLVYSQMLRNFPFIQLSSPLFVSSCVLVVLDHYIWYQFFTTRYYRFVEIITLHAICVWLIPFCFFISLSANDLTLPTLGGASASGSAGASEGQKKGRMSSIRQVLSYFASKTESLLPTEKSSKNF